MNKMYKTLMSAAVLAQIAMMPSWSIADDLEIFLGDPDFQQNYAGASAQPTIMFVLDESASMQLEITPSVWAADGPFKDYLRHAQITPQEWTSANATEIVKTYSTGQRLSRFDAVKQALLSMVWSETVTIDGTEYEPLQGIRVGLASFGNNDHQILHPVVSVDEEVNRDSLIAAIDSPPSLPPIDTSTSSVNQWSPSCPSRLLRDRW